MAEKVGKVAIIGSLPADLRAALSKNFETQEFPLEGADKVPLDSLPRDIEAVATRALLGVPEGLLEHLPDLRLVLSMGAGVDLIDQDALAARGVELVHTPDSFTEDVADFALGLIYAVQRNIVTGDAFVRAGKWPQSRHRTSRRVSNRAVGIVGLGRIGRRVAEKCAALGMRVAYQSRAPKGDVPFDYFADVTELVRRSDILVLACAYSDETHNLVDADLLAALGPDGIVINISRGAVIDEEALIAALETGTIAGAGLDVFANEPNLDPRFLEFDQVVLSPHAATFTQEAREAVISRLVEGGRDAFANMKEDTASAE